MRKVIIFKTRYVLNYHGNNLKTFVIMILYTHMHTPHHMTSHVCFLKLNWKIVDTPGLYILYKKITNEFHIL